MTNIPWPPLSSGTRAFFLPCGLGVCCGCFLYLHLLFPVSPGPDTGLTGRLYFFLGRVCPASELSGFDVLFDFMIGSTVAARIRLDHDAPTPCMVWPRHPPRTPNTPKNPPTTSGYHLRTILDRKIFSKNRVIFSPKTTDFWPHILGFRVSARYRCRTFAMLIQSCQKFCGVFFNLQRSYKKFSGTFRAVCLGRFNFRNRCKIANFARGDPSGFY